MAAALVGLVEGSGAGVTSVTTTSFTSSASGSTFIIAVADDASATLTSLTDSKSNTYTLVGSRQSIAGNVALSVYKCENGTGGAGHTATANWSSSQFPTMWLMEITGGSLTPVDTGSLAQGTDTSSPYTITSGTLAQADEMWLCLIATDGSASPSTFAESSGFSIRGSEQNGAAFWTSAVGTRSVLSTAAVTPSWTCTNSANAVLTIFGLKSATAGTAVNPGAGSVAITGYAPAIAQPHAVAPGVGSLAITGFAPTIAQPHGVAPGVGSLAITGYAPTLAQTANQSLVPGVGSLALTGYAPSLAQTANQALTPGVGSLTITGYAPTVTQGAGLNLTPGVGSVAITGFAPTIAQTLNQSLIAGAGSVVLTGYAPTISQPQGLTAGVGSIAITGYAPSVSQPLAVSPGAGLLALTGYAPAVAQTANQAVVPGVGSLTVTGYVPTVVQLSASPSLTPDPGVLTIAGYAPEVKQSGGAPGYKPKQTPKQKRAILEAVRAANMAEIVTAVAKAQPKPVQVAAPVELVSYEDDEDELLMLLA